MRTKRLLAAAAIAALPLASMAATGSSVIVTTTGSSGSNLPFSMTQPTLQLTPLIRTDSTDFNVLGEVKWFAGNFAPVGYTIPQGQELSIASNQALFSKFGTTYGGDGVSTFRLPDLRGRAILGAGTTIQMGRLYGNTEVTLNTGQLPAHSHGTTDGLTTSTTGSASPAAIDNQMPSIALQYQVNTVGIFPSRSITVPGNVSVSSATSGPNAFLGFINIDAALDNDTGTLPANNQLLTINSNQALFSLYGTMHGGDGRTTFGLPDTEGRLVVGAGNGPGLTSRNLGATRGNDTVTLTDANLPSHVHSDGSDLTDPAGGGQAINLIEEEVALNYVISLLGTYPSRGTGTSSPFGEPFIGEVALFGGNFAPRGWAFAHGQLLAISQYSALFSILGTEFGGDGRTTFALPDLRGRAPIGTFDRLGAFQGAEDLFLTTGNMPAHTHDITRAAPVPLPAGALLMLSALLGFGLLRRRTT